MSESPKRNPAERSRLTESELPARRDFAEIDCSGLLRAVAMLEAGSPGAASAVALLRLEIVRLQKQGQIVGEALQHSTVELRQLRESAERVQVQQQDEQRQLQDQNDRFVASMIQEHEAELASLRRERDAAIDRVRELSRGITRVGTPSTASSYNLSSAKTLHSTSFAEVSELRARVDDLLHERERSLRLLRQLAEQRDQAESRLQTTLAAIGNNAASLPKFARGEAAIRASTASRLRSDAIAPDGHGEPTLPQQRGVAISPQVASESQQASTSTEHGAAAANAPFALASPNVPLRSRDRGADSKDSRLGALENPDEWDVGSDDRNEPIHPAESSTPGSSPHHPIPSTSMSGSLSISGERVERCGAYSLGAEELAVERVFVHRNPRIPPRGT
jgi:hypothetical protein